VREWVKIAVLKMEHPDPALRNPIRNIIQIGSATDYGAKVLSGSIACSQLVGTGDFV